jgi:hypothetical protein
MAFSPGSGTAMVLSVVVLVAGVFVLAIAVDSAMDTIGWVLIAAGALFTALNLMLLRRGR